MTTLQTLMLKDHNFLGTTWFVSMCLHICVRAHAHMLVREEGRARECSCAHAHTQNHENQHVTLTIVLQNEHVLKRQLSRIQLFPSSCRVKLYLKNGNTKTENTWQLRNHMK
jgi:hypothetical protein